MPDNTDKFDTKHQRAHSRKLELENKLLDVDEPEENWANAKHIIVVSHAHHLMNIESSRELLKLLNFYHGRERGYTIEVVG